MFGWLLRLLLIVLIVRAIWRFATGLLQGAASVERARVQPDQPVPLVKDPICGTYVVGGKALSASSGDTIHYFCSERCRDEFVRGGAGRRSA